MNATSSYDSSVQLFIAKWCDDVHKIDEFKIDLLKLVNEVSSTDNMGSKIDEILSIVKSNQGSTKVPKKRSESNRSLMMDFTGSKAYEFLQESIELYPTLNVSMIVATKGTAGNPKIGVKDIRTAINKVKNTCKWICGSGNVCKKNGVLFSDRTNEYYCELHMKKYNDKMDQHFEDLVESRGMRNVIVPEDEDVFLNELPTAHESEVESDDEEQQPVVTRRPVVVTTVAGTQIVADEEEVVTTVAGTQIVADEEEVVTVAGTQIVADEEEVVTVVSFSSRRRVVIDDDEEEEVAVAATQIVDEDDIENDFTVEGSEDDDKGSEYSPDQDSDDSDFDDTESTSSDDFDDLFAADD
jgi:hypothetical protein